MFYIEKKEVKNVELVGIQCDVSLNTVCNVMFYIEKKEVKNVELVGIQCDVSLNHCIKFKYMPELTVVFCSCLEACSVM